MGFVGVSPGFCLGLLVLNAYIPHYSMNNHLTVFLVRIEKNPDVDQRIHEN